MSNPGQPTVSSGSTGNAVRRVQRALRRTPNLGLVVDGIFGPATLHAVTEFQSGSGLVADGIVGPLTWAALPDGGPMPVLAQGANGQVVKSLQTVLANGAAGQWNVSPGPADGMFGVNTRLSVKAFQTWAAIASDGIVGEETWDTSLNAASATLESVVGLQFVIA